MHEADDAYSIRSTWSCYWLDQFLTLALNILILSIFTFQWICLPIIFLILVGVELPLCVVVTILACCVTFSGVKLSIRSFVLFTDFTGYVLFIIASFLARVESADRCLLNSKVLSCFPGVIMSIRSFFLFGLNTVLISNASNTLFLSPQMPIRLELPCVSITVFLLVIVMIFSKPPWWSTFV